MPHHQIDIVLSWAKEIKGLVFLDVQVGHSTLQVELPTLVKYLQLPQVHLGIDPEFSMKNESPPGNKIGTTRQKISTMPFWIMEPKCHFETQIRTFQTRFYPFFGKRQNAS